MILVFLHCRLGASLSKEEKSRAISPVWVGSLTTSKDLRPNPLHGRIGPLPVGKPKKLNIVGSLGNQHDWFIFWHTLSKVKIRSINDPYQLNVYSFFVVCPFLWCSRSIRMMLASSLQNVSLHHPLFPVYGCCSPLPPYPSNIQPVSSVPLHQRSCLNYWTRVQLSWLTMVQQWLESHHSAPTIGPVVLTNASLVATCLPWTLVPVDSSCWGSWCESGRKIRNVWTCSCSGRKRRQSQQISERIP